ncbi:MAG: hypothetical protein LBU23_04290, partial [Planctomycetota bacterium]|nr:hypothetical protein [Planctomycetota bacterium]
HVMPVRNAGAGEAAHDASGRRITGKLPVNHRSSPSAMSSAYLNRRCPASRRERMPAFEAMSGLFLRTFTDWLKLNESTLFWRTGDSLIRGVLGKGRECGRHLCWLPLMMASLTVFDKFVNKTG